MTRDAIDEAALAEWKRGALVALTAAERAVLEAAKRYAKSLQGPRTNASHIEWDEAITELCETARKLGES